MKYTIATLASHSSLQILKGAKDEGFETLAIAIRDNAFLYKKYNFIDRVMVIDNYQQYFDCEDQLKKLNCIIIPHGSFVAYLGARADEKINLPYFGNKKILEIEGDRLRQHEWLNMAKINLPKIFCKIEDVDRMVIVKFYGAAGGSGYFIAKNKDDLNNKMKKINIKKHKLIIQEYIIGVPVYLQFFYSPIFQRLELMGIDRRYESNVDGIGRIPASLQMQTNIEPSFTVIGNYPIVLRESLLPQAYKMGEAVIFHSKRLAPLKGLYGPFCLETIIDSKQQFYCIEISCRIVAGTNLYINGSPYSDLLFDRPMSTGRRIALEIKEAIKRQRLEEILS